VMNKPSLGRLLRLYSPRLEGTRGPNGCGVLGPSGQPAEYIDPDPVEFTFLCLIACAINLGPSGFVCCCTRWQADVLVRNLLCCLCCPTVRQSDVRRDAANKVLKRLTLHVQETHSGGDCIGSLNCPRVREYWACRW